MFLRPLFRGAVGALALLAPLAAQPEGAEDDDVIELSPFIVSTERDTGYLATNATSGTRLNMELKNLPMAIEVITSEFLRDTASTDLKEALAYTSGTFFDIFEASSGGNARAANLADSTENSPSANAAGTNALFTNSLTIRGFRTDTQQRNGFRIGGSVPEFGIVLGGLTDSVNTERVEVVKGPAALLYGVNVLSGVVNIMPKRPLPTFSGGLFTSYGSEDFFRTSVEATGPIALGRNREDNLNWRVAGAWEDRGDWTDFRERAVRYFAGQLEYYRGSKMRIFAEVQVGQERIEGIGDQFIFDDLGSANANGRNFVFIDRADVFRNTWFEQYNWLRDGDELAARGFPGFHEKPQSFRISGPDTYFERDEINLMLDFEYELIENMIFKIAGYRTMLEAEEFNLNVRSANNQDFDVIIDKQSTPRTNPVDVNQDLITVFANPSDNPPPGGLIALEDDKLVRYWWYEVPTETTTDQLRAELTYTREMPFLFDTVARHTFLAGRSEIRDHVDHVIGRSDADEVSKMPNRNEVYQQRSIYDDSIFRYDDEPLAYPADLDRRELFVNRGTSTDLVSGSNFQTSTVWQTGHYAVYQGSFLDDKLYALIGWRHDRLQVKEREKGIIVQEEQKIINFVPVSFQVIQPGFTDEPFREEYNFDEAQKHESWTFALRYALNDDWSIYALSSEGVFPNTGQRDGNDDPIGPETTQSFELGVKFDLFDRKISGGVSLFQIRRENAVWRWNQAPNPSGYAPNIDPATIRSGDFDPVAAEVARLLDDPSSPIYNKVLSYGVHREYFNEDEWFPKLSDGETTRWTDNTGQNYPGIVLVDLGGDPKVFLDYNKLDTEGPPLAPDGVTYRDILEAAFADAATGRDDIDPVFWGQLDAGNNASNNVGANVLFEDEANGIELNLILSPLPNWQLIFNYAHITREVDGPFTLTAPSVFAPEDLDDDFARLAESYPSIAAQLTAELKQQVADALTSQPLGTEYDRWVAGLGRDAYDDPRQADSLNGGGIAGESLYFGPEDTASFWTKYRFREGVLDGLALNAGVRYTGPAQTAITVGGNNLSDNRFPTPETAERFQVDTAVFYEFAHAGYEWRIALNVYNVLDDTYGVNTVTYRDEANNREEKRRTERWYAPRSYRLSLSVNF